MEFNFTNSDNIQPGTGTQYLVIQTPGVVLSDGHIGFIDSSTDTEAGLISAPASATTPEPSSLALLGTGIIGLAGMLRKRFA